MLQEIIISHMDKINNAIAEAQRELDEIGKGGTADNFSRSIIHDERNIYVWKKADFAGLGIPLTFDYSEDLFSYLARPDKCCFEIKGDTGRATIELTAYHRAHLHRKAEDRARTTIGQFAYHYYESGLPAEDFEMIFPSIRKMNSDKEKNGDIVVIDHVNDNHFINNRWNLSATTKGLNSTKKAKLSQIKPPYFCYPAVCPDGGYRLRFGSTMLPGQNVYVYCPTIEDLIFFLDSVYNDAEICKHPELLEDYSTPQYLRATRKTDKFYFSGQFETAEREALNLLNMPEDKFIVWRDGYNALKMLFDI